jgi:hypothetical protein
MPLEATAMLKFLFHTINNNYNLSDTLSFKLVATLEHLRVLKYYVGVGLHGIREFIYNKLTL